MSMELEALKEKVRASKLHPVHVADSVADEGARGHRFIGSLEEYLDTMRAIATPVVFICTEAFGEWDFFHTPETEDGVPDVEAESVDLRSVVSGLRGFEKHMGAVAMYKLFSSTLAEDSIDFIVNEPWWVEFLKLRATATDQVDGDLAASKSKSRADREAGNRRAFAALGGLIKDQQFARLPTQKAMMAYAIDHIPELQAVDELALRTEIQNLHAQIKAKGLDRKR